MRDSASAVGSAALLRGLGLPIFQLRLTELRGFSWVRSRLQGGLFEEISPARMPVRGALLVFEVLQNRLCVLPSFDDLDNPGRFVSADVVADYNIRSFEVIVCQMHSPSQPEPSPTLRICAAVAIGNLRVQ